MSRSLLLISRHPEDRAFAQEVANVAGLAMISAQDGRTGAELIAKSDVPIILVDATSELQYREFESSVQDKIGLFSDKLNANAIHFISALDIDKTKHLINSPLFGHFILRAYGDPKAAGQHYGRMVKATFTERAFGIQQLLSEGAKVQVVKLEKSNQKQDAVEAVKNYLLAAKFQSRMAAVIANAVDEIMMNAIFDAPVDELGKPLLDATSRATTFDLKEKHHVEMHVGFDGTYVAIQAIDLFGSLDKVKLLNHISKIYTEEEYKVKTTVAGAGIGLATVFRSGASLFFVSESRTRTEVTVMYRKTDSFREFKEQFRFLSTQFYF